MMPGPTTAIFWPVLSHMLVVLLLFVGLFRARVRSVRKGEVKPEHFRLNRSEPESSLIVLKALNNQFETPVLFYLICTILYVTGHATLYPVILAWLWFFVRLAHLRVFLTTNRLRHRMQIFIASIAILGLMWLWLVIALLLP